MIPVLLANLAWVLFLAFWCVLYFAQSKADGGSGSRYKDQ